MRHPQEGKEQSKKIFEELSMDTAESMNEYIARAKSSALHVKYHGIKLTEQEISLRVLNGLLPHLCSREA